LAGSGSFATGDPDLMLGDGTLAARLHSRGHASLVFRVEGLWGLSEEDIRLLVLWRHQMETHLENLHLWLDALDAQLETVHLLADAVETRSKETGAHTRRVGELSWILGKGLGLDPQRVEVLHRAAPLHDLGKIAIPDSVLNKPGKLTPEEWAVMKTHSLVGYEILSKSMRGPMQMAALIARDHHEKWDGSGYPRGVRGAEISQEGRIVALVDVVDALLSHRCYKRPWPLEDVLAFVREQSGCHFDPEVVDVFFCHLSEILAIRRLYPDMGSENGA
jgi:HD-GYP domain-containing protein (c-di-GMP phosphodiesterase class II)